MPRSLRFVSAFLFVVFLAGNVSRACADPHSQKSVISFASPASLAAKLGLQWTDLDAHIAARTEKEKAATVRTQMLLARKELIAGDLPRSREALREAKELAPTLPEAAYLHALLLYFAKDEQAEIAFREMHEQLPDNFHVRNYFALMLSESRTETGRPIPDNNDLAIKLARQNAKLFPDSTTAQVSLAFVLLWTRGDGQYAEGILIADQLGQRLLIAEGRVRIESEPDAPLAERNVDSLLTLDEAYLLAKCLAAAPSAKYPNGLTAAGALFRTAVVTPGPFRNHRDADDIMSNGVPVKGIVPRTK